MSWNSWEILKLLCKVKNWQILESLYEARTPLRGRELSKITGISESDVSKSLSELREKDLVRDVNRGNEITPYGIYVVESVKGLELPQVYTEKMRRKKQQLIETLHRISDRLSDLQLQLAFADLIESIRSEEFREILNDQKFHGEFRRLLSYLQSHDVPLEMEREVYKLFQVVFQVLTGMGNPASLETWHKMAFTTVKNRITDEKLPKSLRAQYFGLMESVFFKSPLRVHPESVDLIIELIKTGEFRDGALNALRQFGDMQKDPAWKAELRRRLIELHDAVELDPDVKDRIRDILVKKFSGPDAMA
jgi:DNA-binding transcriptional regulator GbsR (MarR family)